jgi:hypothetical protein
MSNPMDHVNKLIAMQTEDIRKERDRLASALFEVVDAVASLDKPWDLQGYGIQPKRAEEICELAALGKPK